MSEKKKSSLARSAVLMGVIILISKLAGLVRDQLIAASFGTTAAAVAYETASKLPLTIFDFVLGGVVTSAFIPIYNAIAVNKNKKEAIRFAQSYFNLIITITTLIAAAGVILAPWLVRLIAPELASETAALATQLTRIMFPMVIFVGLAFSFVGFLESEGEYNIPAIISLVSNAIMILYLIFFADRGGVVGLSFAMLAGWGAQALVQIPAAVRRGFRYKLFTPLNTPEIKQAAINTLPILVATWTTPVCTLINNRIASGIDEGRAITALGYANRLYIIIVGLFSFVATNLIFPHISRAVASGDRQEGERLTRSSIKILVFIIAPIAVGVAALAPQFISLIYERGEFNPSDTAITSEAMRAYAVGMLFAAVNEVLTKVFFAAQKMIPPMISSLISMAANIIVILVLGSHLGVGGIALVSGLATALNTVINYAVARRMGLLSRAGRDAVDLIKSAVSALVMGAAVLFVADLVSGFGKLVSFALPVLAGAVVYAIVALILRSDETIALIGTVRARLGKKS